MNAIQDYFLKNKWALPMAALLLILLVACGKRSPQIGDFVSGLTDAGLAVETFSGQELKDMNTLVNSGKSGALIFTIITRVVVYAGSAFTPQQAKKAAEIALSEMATIKANGVLVSVWRYPYGWQAEATLAVEKLIHQKDMESNLGNFCREPGNEHRITCSKFISFTHQNFFITISAIKEKVVVNNGAAVDCVVYDDATLKTVHDAIRKLRL